MSSERGPAARSPTVVPMNGAITVASADNPLVSDYRQLGDRTARRKIEGNEFFISEGWMSIERLCDSQHHFRSALLSPSRLKRFQPFLGRPELQGIPVYVAERDVMHDIVGFDLPRGVLVSADRRPLATVDELAASSNRLVVLDGLDDDESVGAIARVARAFGVSGMVLGPTCTDPYHRRTVRVSMGEILQMRVAQPNATEWPDVLDTLHGHGFGSWAMSHSDTVDSVWDIATPTRLAIVFGAEHAGVDPQMLATATRRVTIPIDPSASSLNVGHAAAITFAALARTPRR
jgi:tRNA G18 (ribose-2'-O)-methylase SpoU